MNVQNPFPGLRAFGEEESHLFFGRERPTDELLRKLRSNRFIAVVGTSGSGKSSLVRAGMLPDLYGGLMTSAGSSWRVALFRPGNAPIKALADALSHPEVIGSSEADAPLKRDITEAVLRRGATGLVTVTQQARMAAQENLLVVIDQFEELFRFKNAVTNVGAADEAAAFVKLIIEASTQTNVPIYIVLTMRSEFLGDCTQFRDLPEAINSSQYLIPRMTRDQQKAAINGPVAVGGASLTPRLLQRLLNDVGDNPDQLPILQHAMMRTWDNWQKQGQLDKPLDIAHYEAIGTMQEALCQHADEAFNELTDAKLRQLTERLFKRLTEKGVDNRELRFPAQVDELCLITGASKEELIHVIDVFRQEGRWFLMPPPDVELVDTTLIDISHESLIRIWRQLQLWVNEEAESARIYRRLSESSTLFEKNEVGLWRNPELQIALRWRERNDPNKVWAARYSSGFDRAIDFLDKSRIDARRRKLLMLAPVVLVPLVGFVLVAGFLQARAVDRAEAKFENEAIQAKAQFEIDVARAEAAEATAKLAAATAKAAEDRALSEVEDAFLQANKFADQKEMEIKEAEKDLAEAEFEGTALKIAILEASGKDASKIIEQLDQQEQKLEEIHKIKTSENAQGEDASEITEQLKQEVQQFVESGSYSVAEPESDKLVETAVTDEIVVADLRVNTTSTGEDNQISVDAELEASKASASSPVLVSPAEFVASIGPTTAESGQSTASASTTQFSTCAQVEALEPTGCGREFPPGKVWLFARIRSDKSQELTLDWYASDKEELRSRQLKIEPNATTGYRTYDWKTLMEPGEYEVRLVDSETNVLNSQTFTITAK